MMMAHRGKRVKTEVAFCGHQRHHQNLNKSFSGKQVLGALLDMSRNDSRTTVVIISICPEEEELLLYLILLRRYHDVHEITTHLGFLSKAKE
jgi:hypothetical protein